MSGWGNVFSSKESNVKGTSVFGIYNSRAEAQNAIDRMFSEGFRSTDISALLPDDFVGEETKAPESSVAGATSGGVIGGTLGLLAGIGALAIPGVGPFIAAGPIMGALAGVGAGATVGGLVGALVGMGIPEYEAKRFESDIKQGGVLVSVHCEDAQWAARAKTVMEKTGAKSIHSTGHAGSDAERSERDTVRRGDYS